ncbi:HK97 gp10 family phage protein [Agreia sp. COWG]|uniref:HK97 gp10 family phage protein n=1 Tax=Agreia sp. COWG TaxID=2773266 RepID=UPI00192956FB|nr:HK97 gp10 family phage protein [Agreia sp. COWG]CAD5999250.1 putative Bacteriophage HK97-gp10 tail-component [Agreia sp. COWG]
MKFNASYFDQLGRSSGVRALVTQKAESVAARARAAAPVDTGEYRDGIHVEVSTSAHRVVATVVASSEHSMIVESQTGNLRRALNGGASGG